MSARREAIRAIAGVIRRYRFRYVDETALQAALTDVLAEAGYDVEREVRLDSRSRIDLKIGDIGIEVKVAGSAGSVMRQLHRYALSPEIGSLILVTNRLRHSPPDEIGDVPLEVVYVGAGL